MAVKHTLVAGVTALALLITPVGLTVQWNDHGPAMATAPAVSAAYAAPNRPTTKKPPTAGGPTFTSGGTTTRTTGYQTGSGKASDFYCQAAADVYDEMQDQLADANAAGDVKSAESLALESEAVLSWAATEGFAFIH